MIDRTYLLHRPPPPEEWKRRFDQDVVPAAINLLGSIEVAVERVAVGVRRTPVTATCIALGIGFLLARSFGRGDLA